jgi:hypothetical protein
MASSSSYTSFSTASGSAIAHDSGASCAVASRGCRFCEISSTKTPNRNAIRITSAPAIGISPRVDDSDMAAVASRPMPRPARSVSLASKSKVFEPSSKCLPPACQLWKLKVWKIALNGLFTYPMKMASSTTQRRTPSIDPESGPLRSSG